MASARLPWRPGAGAARFWSTQVALPYGYRAPGTWLHHGAVLPSPYVIRPDFYQFTFSPGEKAKLAQVGQTPSRKSAADTYTQPLVDELALLRHQW